MGWWIKRRAIGLTSAMSKALGRLKPTAASTERRRFHFEALEARRMFAADSPDSYLLHAGQTFTGAGADQFALAPLVPMRAPAQIMPSQNLSALTWQHH